MRRIEPRTGGLATLMHCLSELAEFDGAQLGVLVDREQCDEFLQAARQASEQLDALIRTLEASALAPHERGKLA